MTNYKRMLSVIAVPLLAIGFAATPWEDLEAATGNVELDEAEVLAQSAVQNADGGRVCFEAVFGV